MNTVKFATQQPVQRYTVATAQGFRTYGAFTAVLDTDKKGNVIYSNMTPDSREFQQMIINNRKFRKAQ